MQIVSHFRLLRVFFIGLFFCQVVGCMEKQTGQYEVSRHAMVRGNPDYTEVDLFFGRRVRDSDRDAEELLLSFVFWDGGAESNRSARSFLSRGGATTCRVEFNGKGNTVTYGSFWDRQNDIVTVGSKEFRRLDGNILLILGPNSPEPKYVQIPVQAKSEIELIEALAEFAKSHLDLPAFTLDR